MHDLPLTQGEKLLGAVGYIGNALPVVKMTTVLSHNPYCLKASVTLAIPSSMALTIAHDMNIITGCLEDISSSLRISVVSPMDIRGEDRYFAFPEACIITCHMVIWMGFSLNVASS